MSHYDSPLRHRSIYILITLSYLGLLLLSWTFDRHCMPDKSLCRPIRCRGRELPQAPRAHPAYGCTIDAREIDVPSYSVPPTLPTGIAMHHACPTDPCAELIGWFARAQLTSHGPRRHAGCPVLPDKSVCRAVPKYQYAELIRSSGRALPARHGALGIRMRNVGPKN